MKTVCFNIYKIIFLLLFGFLFNACKKEESVKKDYVDVEFDVSVGLNNILTFKLLNGTEELYAGSVVGENKKTDNGHPISSMEKYTTQLPREKTNNLIVKYGIEVRTREQGWGGWFRLSVDQKDYVSEAVTKSSVLKSINLEKPLYVN